MKGMLYVHRKKAKGRTYYYFALGRDESGARMLKRLPDIRSPGFAKAYAAAKGMRSKGESAGGSKNFDWLCGLYERSSEFRALAENSKRQYSRHLAYARENFRNRAGRSWPLDVITAEHVVALRDKFADTPGKANAILKAVGAIYAWAKRPGRRYVKDNITAGVDPLEMGEHDPWPLWLVEKALDDPAVRLPVALLYYLGQRIGDTVKLGQQNMAHGLISVTQQKTGMTLKIAVHSRLAAIIDADAPKDAMVFLLNDKGKPVTESGLRQRLQKWAKDHDQHIVPHGLRKNAVNALLESGCSTAEVSAITGQDLKTIEHYAKERDREHLGRSAILKFEARNKA
jgi:integrase